MPSGTNVIPVSHHGSSGAAATGAPLQQEWMTSPMKYRRLLFAFGLVALSACSDPTAPRLPQPDEEEEEEPDSPGIGASATANHYDIWLNPV
jgi:hypothetical protein